MASGIRKDIESAVNMLGYGGIESLSDYERQLELKKRIARRDFREYMKLMYPGYVGGRHIDIIIETLEAVERGEIKRLILSVPPRHALADNTPVPTTMGWKRHGDLVVGDNIYGPDWEIIQVVTVFPKVPMDYVVVIDDGTWIACSAGHLWEVYKEGFTDPAIAPVEAIAETGVTDRITNRPYFSIRSFDREGNCELVSVADVFACPPGVGGNCITVSDPSGLYLVGDKNYITHNSKSMHTSEGFPSWYLGRHPDNRIIAAAHTQRLAEKFSRTVRNQVTSSFWPFPWVSIAPDNGGVGQWSLDGHGGAYLAVGVGSSPTGQGGDLILIDDPIRDQQDADSPVIREKLWEWFTGTLYTRRQPGASIIVTQTRWNEDDLVGRLIDHAGAGGDDWHVINIPAENPDGTFLWPEFWSDEEYLMAKRSSTRVWNAQYMGRPSTEGGNLLRESWFQKYELQSAYSKIVVSYDIASKVGLSNDYSACVVIGVKPTGYDILLVTQAKVEFPELIREIHNRMAWVGSMYPRVPSELVIEDASSGTAAIQSLRSSSNYTIIPAKSTRTNEKEVRVMEVAPIVEAGRVFLPDISPWYGDFMSQITQFPYDKHDDIVDAFSHGLKRAAGIGSSSSESMSVTRYNDDSSYGELSYEGRRSRLRGDSR